MKASINRTLLLLGSTVVFGSVPMLAQGCGGHGGSAASCCPVSPVAAAPPDGHENHSPAAAAPASNAPAKLEGAEQVVFDRYFVIQTALASDSVKDVATSATALAKAVRDNPASNFPAEAANQAEALAKAKDLLAARTAFKPLSDLLIQHARGSGLVPGTIYEVYCPMAKAGWLQADKAVKNPYFGPSMLRCGTIKG